MTKSRHYAEQFLATLVALVVIGSVTFIGQLTAPAAHAKAPGTLYASPAAAGYKPGSTIKVEIRVDSGEESVSSVQAAMQYNAAQLQLVGIDDSAEFPVAAATSESAGQIRLARSVGNGARAIAGDRLVATVYFDVIATSGIATISFDEKLSLIVRASDSTNILTKSTGANYMIGTKAEDATASPGQPHK